MEQRKLKDEVKLTGELVTALHQLIVNKCTYNECSGALTRFDKEIEDQFDIVEIDEEGKEVDKK